MDAVLKHLGLRSDFIVCHPEVIDDPLFHASRPPHPLTSSPATLYFSASSPHSPRVYWEFETLAMDPGARH